MPIMFIEYPKSLYRGSVDDHVIVKDKASEEEQRAQGYTMYAELTAAPVEPVKTRKPRKEKAE